LIEPFLVIFYHFSWQYAPQEIKLSSRNHFRTDCGFGNMGHTISCASDYSKFPRGYIQQMTFIKTNFLPAS